MPFEPSISNSNASGDRPGLLFIFSDSRLLVRKTENAVIVPDTDDFPPDSLADCVFLGYLNRSPCYSGTWKDNALSHGYAEHEYVNLRNLYGHTDKEIFTTATYGFQILNWHKNNRFCGRCGRSLEDKTDERAKICGGCGLIVYPRISPAIIVAVTKGDKILLARSAQFTRSRMYSVIAGYAETGETLEECVERELKEEVGIRVKNIRYFGSQPWPYSGSLMIGFTAEHAGGEICPDGEEITDAGWFSAGSLPEIPAWGSIARKLIDGFTASRKAAVKS